MDVFLPLLAVATLVALWAYGRRSRARPGPAQAPRRRAHAAGGPAPVRTPAGPAVPEVVGCEEAAACPDFLQGFELATVDALPERQREQLAATLAAIALPPRSAQSLMSPEFLANAATREFTDLVTCEPLLAAKVIGRVNSAFYGLARPIVSVAHAVTYLGMNAVRNMALQFAIEQAFESEDPELQAFHAQLFDAGTISAELCAVLAPKLGIKDVGAASTQSVLSFLGDFAMPSLLPPGSAIANWPLGLLDRTLNEQMTIGVNSMIVGSLLMDSWGMPATVRDDVRDMTRIMIGPAAGTDRARETRLALCFACARIGESIALGRIRDPALIDFAPDLQPEYFHLQSYLRQPPLHRLAEQLRAPDVQLVLARLIAGTAKPQPRLATYQSRRTA